MGANELTTTVRKILMTVMIVRTISMAMTSGALVCRDANGNDEQGRELAFHSEPRFQTESLTRVHRPPGSAGLNSRTQADGTELH